MLVDFSLPMWVYSLMCSEVFYRGDNKPHKMLLRKPVKIVLFTFHLHCVTDVMIFFTLVSNTAWRLQSDHMVAEDNFNPVAMASCTDGFHFTVQHIHMRPQMFLGESSTLDEVFLSGRPQGHDRVYSTVPQDVELLLEKDTSVVDSSEQEDILGRSGPSCYQLSISSVILISIICILVVTCRNYVKDLLLWLEQTDPYISVFIFLLLFIVTSFPMAWGYILLMVAAGYLYGYLYGPMVVLICGTVGIIVAHVVMKNCCRDFIKRRFYNSKMEAVIKVVESSQGFKLIALSRLTPIPFGLQNGLFAVSAWILFMKFCELKNLEIKSLLKPKLIHDNCPVE